MTPAFSLSKGPLAMVKPVRRSATRWQLLASVILAAGVLLAPIPAAAEIILDDFDEPFEIILPQTGTGGDTPIIQSDVGPLGIERRSSLVNILSKPTGRLDANISRSSTLTFSLDRLNPTSAAAPIDALNLNYFFDEMDVTQNGANDRVIVDFLHLRSAIPLARVDVFMHDSQSNFVSQHFDISPQDGMFELEFPFDSFSERGGGGGQIDPTRIHSLYFSIIPVYFTNINEIDFSTVVERIRFTGAIPEPATDTLAYFAIVATSSVLTRRRR